MTPYSARLRKKRRWKVGRHVSQLLLGASFAFSDGRRNTSMGDEQLIGALRRALKPKRGGAPSDKQLAAVIALERGQTGALTALPEGGARNRARQLHSRAVDLGLFQSQMSTATMDVLPAAPSMASCIDMLPSDMLVHSSNSSGRRRQQCRRGTPGAQRCKCAPTQCRCERRAWERE